MTSDGVTQRGDSLTAGLRLAVSLLTAIPVQTGRVDRATAGTAMLFAPWVGLGLGFLAGLVSWLTVDLWPGSLLSAVLAVAALALLTRALHLDGLADRPRKKPPENHSCRFAPDLINTFIACLPGSFPDHAFNTSINASCGMLTEPNDFIRFLPSFCFSSSLRLRVMSPP